MGSPTGSAADSNRRLGRTTLRRLTALRRVLVLVIAVALVLVGLGFPGADSADAAPHGADASEARGQGLFGKQVPGIDAQVPLKSAHAGKSIDDGEWDHEESDHCGGLSLAPGEVLWHFVLGPLRGATDAATALESYEWGISGLNPSEAELRSGLRGANADWYVVNTHSTAPNDLVAFTDGGKERKGSKGSLSTFRTELRVSSTCRSPERSPVGFVEIGKVEAGAYAPSVPGMYTIQYSGGGLTGSVEVVGGSSVLVELPVGTYVLSELDTPVNATVAFSVNPVTVVEGGPSAAVGVTVTNSFDTPG